MISPASQRDSPCDDERRVDIKLYACHCRRVAATASSNPSEITNSQGQIVGSTSSGCSPVPGSVPRVMRRPIEAQRGWPPSYFKQAVFCTSTGGFTPSFSLATMISLMISPGATEPIFAVTLLPLAEIVPLVVVSVTN